MLGGHRHVEYWKKVVWSIVRWIGWSEVKYVYDRFVSPRIGCTSPTFTDRDLGSLGHVRYPRIVGQAIPRGTPIHPCCVSALQNARTREKIASGLLDAN